MENTTFTPEQQVRVVDAVVFGEKDPIDSTVLGELDNGDNIDDLLADLDDIIASTDIVEDTGPEEIIEEPSEVFQSFAEAVGAVEEIAPTDEMVGDALRELEIQEAKAEAYAEQESAPGEDLNTELPEPEVVATTAEVVAKEEKPKRKRESSEGKKKSEIITSHLGAESAGFFVLEMDDAELDANALREREKATLEMIDALPKKVGEKATNLFGFLKTGEHLSIYTKIALNLLLEKGTFTSEALRDKMLAEGYTQGTSSSQAQQMMQLLPALKIGVRVKNIMTKNPDSTILMKYEASKAAPAA